VWFAPDFETTPHGAALIEDLRCTEAAGYAACCDALAVFDLRDRLAEVTVPTLAVSGRLDPATPPAHSREITDGIPGAALVEVAGAAHLANAEYPDAVTSALLVHHDGLPRQTERRGPGGPAPRPRPPRALRRLPRAVRPPAIR
jgi:pimeloyl-ACP methyl ester carboxylesterase